MLVFAQVSSMKTSRAGSELAPGRRPGLAPEEDVGPLLLAGPAAGLRVMPWRAKKRCSVP
jgi:hypothetical protein